MGVIKSLQENVISRIAAGEVIERPAYIVKELIENAIDAHAKQVRISLEKYGLSKIVVQDDGCGMDTADISLCYLRHTTSKIASEGELYTIKSLGFRGEALASIAAVGKALIRSRPPASTVGREVIVDGGIVTKSTARGMPVGTQVIVDNIFSHVPVRKHFLQSPQSEYRFILDIFERYALAFPHISFDLTHDGKRILTIPQSETLLSRITQLLPGQLLQHLIPVEHRSDDIAIEGYISPPQIQYKTQRNSRFYVNNRFVKDSSFMSVVKDAYGTLLEPLAYPYTLLFLSIPHHRIDVNVHPRKETIHLLERERVLAELNKAVGIALSTQSLTWGLYDGGTNTYAASILKDKVAPIGKERKPIRVSDIVQVHDTYLIIPTDTGVLMIDQHAAHERILFEEFQNAFIEEKKLNAIQTLKEPVLLLLSQTERELVKEKSEEIERLGFTLSISDAQIFITTVPKLFQDRDVQQFVRDILDDLSDNKAVSAYDAFSRTMLEYLSCRSAVKAGDMLTKNQAKELVEKLNTVENPYTCPHGRPVQVEMSRAYIDKLFKRK